MSLGNKSFRPNVFLLLLISILWIGIAYSRYSIEPQYFPDTKDYFPQIKELHGVFSITGNAIRGWPTVLIFRLAKDANQATFFQAVIYATSWTLFLLVWFKNRINILSGISAALIVFYALSPRVLQWNQFLLSESLSVSLVIFGLAAIKGILNNLENGGKQKYIWILLASIFFSLASVNRLTLMPLGLIPFIVFFFSIKNFRSNQYVSLTVFIFLIFSLLYPIFYNVQTNKFWGDSGQRLYRSSFYFLYNTVEGGLQPEWGNELWKFVNSRAPECLIWYRTDGFEPSRNPYFLAEQMPKDCPQAASWLDENFDEVYLDFIISHPKETFSYALEMLNLTQDSTEYINRTILPKPIYRFFESPNLESRGFKDNVNELRPVYFWFALPIISILILPTFRIKPNKNTVLTLLYFLCGLASISLTQFAIVSEPVRITTPATVFTITSAILVFNEVIQQIMAKSRNSQPK